MLKTIKTNIDKFLVYKSFDCKIFLELMDDDLFCTQLFFI